MKKYHPPFYTGTYYHVYNRTNNGEALFLSDGNRGYFLQKYREYLADYVKTYAYCLLDNHFHFLIQVREEEELWKTLQAVPYVKRTKLQQELITELKENKKKATEIRFEKIISQQFQRFFSCYSKAFNRQHDREGNLFNQKFKRILVKEESHFTQLIYYIHANTLHHGYDEDFRTYPWNSYSTVLSQKPTQLERKAVLDWFGGRNGFTNYHLAWFDLTKITNLMIED